MSRSPESRATRVGPLASANERAYRKCLSELDQLVENGASWSGHERNCAFLNLGAAENQHPEFATISAVSGLDFLDDGRAHALVDWDRDGDVDVWSINRTAPRVRYLGNQSQNGHHFLALRLIGQGPVNRDAVGAKVEVFLSHNSPRRLVKSLRAGDGFLSQSTKWLHFGLGKYDAVTKVVIDWPGGSQQIVREIAADRFYEVTLNSNRPKDVSPSLPTELVINPDSASREESAPTIATQVLLTSRLPLPRLEYTTLSGATKSLTNTDQALCVILWATWCEPCVRELRQVSSQADALEKQGVRFLALSVDGIHTTDASLEELQTRTPQQVADFLQSLNVDCDIGMAFPETVRRLQFAQGLPFGRQYKLALPTSFLIDSQGRLAAIYRGPLPWDRLRKDAATLELGEADLLVAALPFPGTWFDGRRRFASLAIVADLFDRKAFSDAFDFVQSNHDELARQPGFAEVVGVLGTELAQASNAEDAVTCYRQALAQDPNNVPILNNFAWYLATHASADVRDGSEAVRWAERAAKRTNHQSAAILDTLAAAYAEKGDFPRALSTVDRAIDLAQNRGDQRLIARLSARRRNYAQQRPYRDLQ